MNDSLENAKVLLSQAKKVIILAGAGMSQELGVKTYWDGSDKKYGSQLSPYGFSEHDHAQGGMWKTHREIQIGHYHNSLAALINTDVNGIDSPYKVLYDYFTETNKEYFVVTSNVDAAFIRAGYDENFLYEIHGNRINSQCLDFPQEHGIFATDTATPTRCPKCNGESRPNSLFFVDFDFNAQRINKQQDVFTKYRDSLISQEAVVLEIGAGTTIATIRNQSLRINSRHHAPVIRINIHNLTENGGMKNIIKPSPIAPFIHLEMNAHKALFELCDIKRNRVQ